MIMTDKRKFKPKVKQKYSTNPKVTNSKIREFNIDKKTIDENQSNT